MRRRAALLIAGLFAFGLSACGSDGGDGGGGGAAGAPTTTVGLRSIDAIGTTLVDRTGRTLYMTDQDTATKQACDNQDCTSVWKPLTVTAGQTPTGPDEIAAKLTVVRRADGASQVAYDGKPLYTFVKDDAAGVVLGNGARDSFGGPDLTWHAVTTGGPAPAQSSAAPDDGGGVYGY